MTLDTQTRIETTVPAETAAKPPPLFQTIDELRARQERAPGAGHQALRSAAALVGGLLVFTALCAAILFLE